MPLSGFLEQLLDVSDEIEDPVLPQYLQVYLGFSSPSYGTCLPLFGFLLQFEDVNEEIEEPVLPQYLQ